MSVCVCIMPRLVFTYVGEWWKKDVMKIPGDANITGGEPTLSAAFTINGEPGYMYPCSKAGTYIC